MVDIRFKNKRIKDAKIERMQKIELKRYLDSFTSETREQAQIILSKMHYYRTQENKYGYLSFFCIAVLIAALSFGFWDKIYGKIIIIASALAFAVFLFFIVLMAYKTDQLRKGITDLRIGGYAKREIERQEEITGEKYYADD
ncbi:MAG: hypothetical protein ACXQS3_01000 [Candidatus Methanofastidiosia archaeon]